MIPGEYHLVVGSTHLSNGTKINITTIKVHPDFDQKNLHNDIALVKPQKEFTFGDNLKPAEVSKISVNSSGVVVGWDENRDEAEFINVRILSSEECEKLEEDANDREKSSSGQVCGYGGVGVGLCFGDWGNPLMVEGKLVALASYSVESCGLGFPDMYTDVSYHWDWIKKNM